MAGHVTIINEGLRQYGPVGFRLVILDTCDKWVWGEEVMVRGLADHIQLLTGQRVWIGDRYAECPREVLTVVSLAPFSDSVPLTSGRVNILWLHFPASLRTRGEFPLKDFAQVYDFVCFGSRVARKAAGDPAQSATLYVSANEHVYRPMPIPKTIPVVFVGNYHPNLRSPARTLAYLGPALSYGLQIYGSGWNTAPDCLRRAWLGPIHPSHVPDLYARSNIVLSIHGDRHVEYELPNTRIMEAAACGACVVSDTFPEIRALFGNAVLWAYKSADVSSYIECALNDVELQSRLGCMLRRTFLEEYSMSRAASFLMSLAHTCGSTKHVRFGA